MRALALMAAALLGLAPASSQTIPPDLQARTPLTGTERIWIQQNGRMVLATPAQIAALVSAVPGPQGEAGKPRRVVSLSATANASAIATLTFSPAFTAAPVVLVVDRFVGDQLVTGTVTAVSTTGATITVKRSRGTLLLTSGPFEPAPSTAVTVIAIGD